MTLKIYFEQEIYRIPEIPSTFEGLNQLISSRFAQSLPQSWKLYSSDSEGNQVLLTNNIDYLNLLQGNQQDSPQTVRIHIQPVQISLVPANVDIEENKVQEETQPKVMEMDFGGSGSTSSFTFNEESDKKGMKKAKHLIKKIGKIRRAEKRAFLMEKLNRIEHYLTPEQKEELQRKKEKYEFNKIMTQDLPPHHYHRHMMRHHGDEDYHHFRHRHGGGRHHHGRGHHHRGHHGRRHHHHRGHSRSSSASSSSSRDSNQDRHGKKYHKRQFKHEKIYEKLQKVMLIGREGQEAETLEKKFDKICIDSQQGQSTQHHVRCNGCGMETIVGIRYKCSECKEFNFCEVCEAVEEHPHVFLKIRTPETKANINVNGVFHAAHLYKRKQKEKSHRVFKAFKTFKKMSKAMKKGDMKKFSKCHDKFFGKFSEEAQKLLNGACEWRPAFKEQIEEEWQRLKQKNFDRKSVDLIKIEENVQGPQDNIEKYVDDQLSRLTISD